MFLSSLIVSLMAAVILTIIFVWGLRRKGPWSSILSFFTVVFLTSWAGGIWIMPFGPTVRNIQWLPFAITGLVSALILAAAVPSWYTRARTATSITPERRKPPAALLTPYFWLALIVLAITIVVR